MPKLHFVYTAGHGWGIFCFGGIHQVAGDTREFSGLLQIYGIVINPCSTEPGYWQNHVDFILALNASLLLCEKPSTATKLFDVKYSVSPLNFRNVLSTIFCWLYSVHFEMSIICCRKINADNTVFTSELIHRHQLWNKIILHVCRPMTTCSRNMSIHFSMWLFTTTYRF